MYESQVDSKSSDTSVSCTVSKLVSESKVSVVATRYNGGMAVFHYCSGGQQHGEAAPSEKR